MSSRKVSQMSESEMMSYGTMPEGDNKDVSD